MDKDLDYERDSEEIRKLAPYLLYWLQKYCSKPHIAVSLIFEVAKEICIMQNAKSSFKQIVYDYIAETESVEVKKDLN